MTLGFTVNNICGINKKYFAYQTNNYICIININTLKEKRRIRYGQTNNIYKYNDKIIGAISDDKYRIEFFNIKKGEKVFEIRNDYYIHGFIKSKRAKEDIITTIEYSAGYSGYGYVQDYSKNKNKWEKLSSTGSTWSFYLRHIYEMDDFTILVSAQHKLYVLFYPLINTNNIFVK